MTPSESEILAWSSLHPEWKIVGPANAPHWTRMHREYSNLSFNGVGMLVNAIVAYAKKYNHHPVVVFGENVVRVILSTGDEGGRVTPVDLQVAEEIESYYMRVLA